MSSATLGLDQQLQDYIRHVSVNETDLLKQLRHETAQLAESRMQISPEQGQLMSLLVKLVNAKTIIEVGVFTGYSSICLASALPKDGKLIACDINKTWTDIAKQYWQKAGLEKSIDLRLSPALETLTQLLDTSGKNSVDMAFIDADKTNYSQYYELCLDLLRPGGVMLVDNTLWSGEVANPENQSADTVAIRELNKKIAQDERVSSALMTVGDGLTLVLKNA